MNRTLKRTAIVASTRGMQFVSLDLCAAITDLIKTEKFGGDYDEMVQWIRAAEGPFVQGLGANGYVLTLPFDVAKAALAHQLAVEGRNYLAWRYAGVPGFDPPPPVELLEQLANVGLDAAMYVCAPDFMDELEATVGWVNGRMSSNGIFP